MNRQVQFGRPAPMISKRHVPLKKPHRKLKSQVSFPHLTGLMVPRLHGEVSYSFEGLTERLLIP